jgi:hypothetical protein
MNNGNFYMRREEIRADECTALSNMNAVDK